MAHPFVVMLKPAVAMSAQPDGTVIIASLIETLLFLAIGLWMAKNLRYITVIISNEPCGRSVIPIWASARFCRIIAAKSMKEKRTGVISVLLAVGILGAAYAFVNFIVRKDTLLNLPLAPMDVLLTQLYGMIVVLNMFGIVVASCMAYNMEFIV